MPKIMFRPNPVPPPFVPPTPTYDTTVYAQSNPFPTQGGSFATLKISPANVPAFDNVEIYGCYEPLQHADVIASFSMTNDDFDKEIQADTIYSSDEFPYLSIEFKLNIVVVHKANLILSEL